MILRKTRRVFVLLVILLISLFTLHSVMTIYSDNQRTVQDVYTPERNAYNVPRRRDTSNIIGDTEEKHKTRTLHLNNANQEDLPRRNGNINLNVEIKRQQNDNVLHQIQANSQHVRQNYVTSRAAISVEGTDKNNATVEKERYLRKGGHAAIAWKDEPIKSQKNISMFAADKDSSLEITIDRKHKTFEKNIKTNDNNRFSKVEKLKQYGNKGEVKKVEETVPEAGAKNKAQNFGISRRATAETGILHQKHFTVEKHLGGKNKETAQLSPKRNATDVYKKQKIQKLSYLLGKAQVDPLRLYDDEIKGTGQSSHGAPWPDVKQIIYNGRYMYTVDPDNINLVIDNKKNCDVIIEAVQRYRQEIKAFGMYAKKISENQANKVKRSNENYTYLELKTVFILLNSSCEGEYPSLHMDESYTLDTISDSAVLRGTSAWGVLRGLETLYQLLHVPNNYQGKV